MNVSVKIGKYLDAYRLKLVFEKGESGDVDLRDINLFKSSKLDVWATVVWDCGFDVSPETLYERAIGKCIDWAQYNEKNTKKEYLE